MTNDKLTVVPCSFQEASAFVAKHHRHRRPPPGTKFCIAVANKEGQIVGVAMVGRPVARHFDDGMTLEVNRLATDGSKNACSALYGASWRVARELGYRKLITYTLATESGTSLRASGWRCLGVRNPGSWDCASRPRPNAPLPEQKFLWECAALAAKENKK